MTGQCRDMIHQRASDDPESHWLAAATAIDWDIAPSVAFGKTGRWFEGAALNTCHNAIDRHVLDGRGNALALIYHSEMTGSVERFTFQELQQLVALTAGMIKACGVGKGDRVIIYMPMVPEAVVAMLACARIGAIHSVVFGGFAAQELAKRIDDANPKLVLTASCGLEPGRIVAYKPLVDAALALATTSVRHVIVLQRPQLKAELEPGRDLDWARSVANARAEPCVSVAATDPLYILYTSGTTGVPKGVVRDNGGHAVALCWTMSAIYGAAAGDIFWAASDIGWVVGHSYIVYAPLLAGCTTVLYEGKPVGTPDAGVTWRLIERHGVNILFTAPTAIRAIRREDPSASLLAGRDIATLRALFLAGERADPDTIAWASAHLNVPVIDHWWQTELGWPALATCLGLGDREARPGSAGRPVPGYRFAVLDDSSQPLGPNAVGDIAIELPLPPGCLPTLWQNESGFRASYLERHHGHYATGDAGFIDEDGFVHVMSRVDDIINVAGHRLSTGGIEQVLASHPQIAECAVIGAADPLKGQVPVALVVPKRGVETSKEVLAAELVALVRREIGPVASFKTAIVVQALPKTRSGKVLRSAMRRIADGEPCPLPPTLDNSESFEQVAQALRDAGFPSPKPQSLSEQIA